MDCKSIRDSMGLQDRSTWLSGGGGRGAREVSLHWASDLSYEAVVNQ